MSIDSEISKILAKRHPTAEKIDKVKSNLGSLYSLLSNLEQKKRQLQEEEKEKDSNLASKLNSLNFPQLQVLITNQLQVLDKMQMRFKRETLNLAVVANAKQGKSRLLRSLTGLSEDVIPDGDKGHCTGVASTIYPDPNRNETYARIWFHTPESFLSEVITPYYEQLKLGVAPSTISDFKKQLPSLPTELAQNSNTLYREMYSYLEKYHQHLDQYEEWLGTTTSSKALGITNSSKIRQFVAQYDPQGNPTYDYMAVEKCHIFCPFPNAPTSQIAVLDTQGLGDTGIGDEARLIEVIGKSADIILFIKMPHPVSDSWGASEINLYSVANRALANHLPLKKWSFFVLNQTNDSQKGNNYSQCELLKTQVPNTIQVIGNTIIANCADEAQARDIILNPIVNYLAKNLEDLDQKYSASYQRELNQLQTQINKEIEQASNVLVSQVEAEDEDGKFEELFESFWETLTYEMNEIIEKRMDENNNDDEDFKNQLYFQEQVEQVIKTTKGNSGIPLDEKNGRTALEQIEREIVKKGGDVDTAYSSYLNKARTNLTKHFYNLDDGLNRAIEEAKIEVANLFVEQLGFANATEKRGVEFIHEMSELMPDRLLNRNSQIKEAFQILSEYKLSFKGLVLPRIRPLLKGLEAKNKKEIRLEANNRAEAAEQIFNNVETLYSEALDRCKDALKNMLGEPIQAALAILDEFEEQVIRSPKIETEWRLYLRRNKAKIWVNEFGEGNTSINQAEWQKLLEKAKKFNSPDNFQIFN